MSYIFLSICKLLDKFHFSTLRFGILNILHLLQGDHVALLSAMTEMGLKLRLDIPEQAMEIANVFFRSSSPVNEAHVRCTHWTVLTYNV